MDTVRLQIALPRSLERLGNPNNRDSSVSKSPLYDFDIAFPNGFAEPFAHIVAAWLEQDERCAVGYIPIQPREHRARRLARYSGIHNRYVEPTYTQQPLDHRRIGERRANTVPRRIARPQRND